VKELVEENRIVVEEVTANRCEAVKKLDAKVRNTIIQCLTDKHLEYVRNAKTSREMMQSLENAKVLFSRLYLKNRLMSLKCNSESLQEYLVIFNKLIRDLESVEVNINEDDKVCHLIHDAV